MPAVGQVPVIGVRRCSLLTHRLERTPPVQDGLAGADPAHDLHQLAVLERHSRGGAIARAFVAGFGGMVGALATSVGHDSHDLTVVGSDGSSMARR